MNTIQLVLQFHSACIPLWFQQEFKRKKDELQRGKGWYPWISWIWYPCWVPSSSDQVCDHLRHLSPTSSVSWAIAPLWSGQIRTGTQGVRPGSALTCECTMWRIGLSGASSHQFFQSWGSHEPVSSLMSMAGGGWKCGSSQENPQIPRGTYSIFTKRPGLDTLDVIGIGEWAGYLEMWVKTPVLLLTHYGQET